MNPVDYFYKCKKNYEGLTYDNKDQWPACMNTIKANEKGESYIEVKLYDGTFNRVDKDVQEEILYYIEAYIKDHNKEITKMILNKLKDKMESARKTVIEDFGTMPDMREKPDCLNEVPKDV